MFYKMGIVVGSSGNHKIITIDNINQKSPFRLLLLSQQFKLLKIILKFSSLVKSCFVTGLS